MQMLMKFFDRSLGAVTLAAKTAGVIAALALAIPAAAAPDQPQALSGRGSTAAGSTRVEVVDAVAVPANGPIVLDGRFNEEVWQQAPVIGDFKQREPAEGQPPSQRTEARMAYDAVALYVAVRAYDTDAGQLVGILTRRDQRSPSDWIRIVVDSYFDKRSAYEFGVNPVGVKTDRYYFNDGQSDDSWDAVWDVQVERDNDGWRAEFKIPFSQLRFNTLAGGPVGFAVIREVGRLAETVSWPLLSRNANGFVSQFGEMRGLKMAGAPKKFELLPYTVADMRTQPSQPGNPLSNPTDPGAAVGLDMKYAVTPGLTLTATANPDFGQVEADPAVVNLDAFETFFPERRPFFVEGSGTFRFNMDCNDGNCTGMFYSRRIGRAPQGSPELADDEYSKQPDTATIIGAGKLTGRLGGFSLGALTAVTAREDAEIATTGEIGYRELDRRADDRLHRAARAQGVRQPVVAGFHDHLDESPERRRHVIPAEQCLCRRHRLRLAAVADVQLQGYLRAPTSRAAPRRSPACRRTTFTASSGPMPITWSWTSTRRRCAATPARSPSARSPARARASTRFVGYKSPGFDSNDLGFMRRADEKPVELVPVAKLHARQVRAHAQFQHQSVGGWNFGGDRLYSGGNVNSHWTFTNYYSIGGGYQPGCRAVPRSRDARRSGRARQPEQIQRLVLREHRQSQGVVGLLQRRPLGSTPRTALATTSSPTSTGARPRRCR